MEWSLSGQCGDSLGRQDTGGERLLHCELLTCHLSWACAASNTLRVCFPVSLPLRADCSTLANLALASVTPLFFWKLWNPGKKNLIVGVLEPGEGSSL